MCRLTRDGTAEPVSRDRILRHARGQGNIIFPCSADHEQDCQPYPVDPYSAICDDHTYIHTTVVVPGSTYYTVFYRKGLLVDLMVEADLNPNPNKKKHFSARGKVHLVLDRKLMSPFSPVLSTCYHAITTSYQ